MKRVASLGRWLLALFNAPPRASMTLLQKVGRVFLVTLSLFTFSVFSGLVIALGLFLVQRIESGQVGDYPMARMLAILLDSLLVNVICVFILLQIKRLDETLIPPPDSPKAARPPE
jgi:hypothetical protein